MTSGSISHAQAVRKRCAYCGSLKHDLKQCPLRPRLRHAFLALLLVLLFSTQAFAQEDDFPPPGIFIPCCSKGGTGGSTGAVYGKNGTSAWRQVIAAPGDVVTFEFILRAQSAGSLHAWPQTTGGTDMQYLGDPNNPYQKWYWNTGQRSSGGTFCIDCLWQFTATDYNPWVYIDYWDSGDGWDVDLNVTNIVTPKPPVPEVRQVVSPEKKAQAHAKAERQETWALGLGIFAATRPIPIWEIRLAIALMAGAFKLDAMRLKAVDPYDGDYCTPYDASWNWSYLDYQYLPEDGSTPFAYYLNRFVEAATIVDGLHDMLYVSVNRANSAWDAGDYACSDMQYWRAQWALMKLGEHYYNRATALYNLATLIDQTDNPVVDLGNGEAYLGDSVREMSQSDWELAWYFQQ